jgi:cysteinyl-tRNA synthetase
LKVKVLSLKGTISEIENLPSAMPDIININEHIEQKIQERLDAKKSKNWALADQIRDQLKAQGVILEDAPNGTTSWRRG